MLQDLRQFSETQDGSVFFLLALVVGAMLIDFVTGTLGAKMNPDIEFHSKAGINGISRKITIIGLMLFMIPVSVIVPYNAGVALLYALYLGYFGFEMLSVFENLEKMGVDTTILKNFINGIISLAKKKDEDKDK